MTSGNVSNIPMPMAAGVSPGVKTEAKVGSEDFRNVMAKSYGNMPVAADTVTSESKDSPVKVEVPKAEVRKEQEPGRSAAEDVQKISDAVEDFAEDAKEILEEELDVTEEEIDEAMEILGLTAVDLLDQGNVTKLVAELTGCDSSVELLMSDKVANIMQDMKDLTKGVLEQTNLSMEELNRLMQEQPQMQETEITAGVQASPEIPTDAAVQEPVNAPVTKDAAMPNEAMPDAEALAKALTAKSDSKDIEKPVNAAEDLKQQMQTENEGETMETPDVSAAKSDSDGEASMMKNGEENADHLQAADEEVSAEGFKEQTGKTFRENRQQPVSHAQGELLQTGPQQMSVQYQPTTQTIVMESGQVVDVERIIHQITEAARVTISNQSTSLEMLLNPEGLGKVYLHLTHEQGEVNARMAVENEALKEAMEHQMQQLKENLNQQGIKVNSIEVSVGTHEFERNLEENMNHDQQMEEQREQSRTGAKRQRNIDLNNLDDLQGLMTEEETLAAQIMRDNGNSVNYTA